MKVLVINAGSSSLKCKLFEMPSERLLFSGAAERIGTSDSSFHFKIFKKEKMHTYEKKQGLKDSVAALVLMIQQLFTKENALLTDADEIEIIGHRVVHGGETFSKAVLITSEVKEKINELSQLAPLHNPVNYACIQQAEKAFPSAKQVAVFDTAFHHRMPAHSYLYALPKTYYKDYGVRAYGFHGISHKYVTEKATRYLKKPDAKMISIHLGNGCSIAAVKGANSLDTSMGFGPLSGLVMGTRSGDIDPSVLFYLVRNCGVTSEQADTLLNTESGLLGLCGLEDMRDINKEIKKGNLDAAFACEIYAYRIKKYIGAYAAVLNGLDALIFTAGVGENDAYIRELICCNMQFYQIHLDQEINLQTAPGICEISKPDSPVKILIIPTNEELEIARQCYELREGEPELLTW